MKTIISTFVLGMLVYGRLFSQTITQESFSQDVMFNSIGNDSITIEREQLHNILFSLTATHIEVTSEGYDLVNLYGAAPELNDLFKQFQYALPPLSKDRIREYLEGDYSSYYKINAYKNGAKTFDITILYGSDYPYLNPGMLSFVNMLNSITRYYNSFLKQHFNFERRMPLSLLKNYQALLDGVIDFEDKWHSLQSLNPEKNPETECIQMSLIFAQCLINSKQTGPHFDLKTFAISNNISTDRLYYYSSFVKQDQSIIREWIDSLMESSLDVQR